MGEWTKRTGGTIALVAAVLIAGTDTALADPSQTGITEDMTTGQGTLTVDSPASDTATHDILVSFRGGTYSVIDSSGTVAGAGCTQTNPTSVSCGDPAELRFIHLTGGAGADHLQVASFSASLLFYDFVGRDGDDTITASETATRVGADDLSGGPGNDVLTGGPGREFLRGGPGNDTEMGRANGDKLDGGPGNDREYGGPGGDLLFGQEGNDLLLGQGGNDILHPGSGKDIVRGGPGRDRKVR